MKTNIVGGLALLGFVAPITVAVVSGVDTSTEAAGWFLAASWVLAAVGAAVGYLFANEMKER